ncbi:MAG: hypothetical protein JXR77_13920 [Lentisphaeria bacterium]|nr:hypothetical protein [Lentisphaeria bacterium]
MRLWRRQTRGSARLPGRSGHGLAVLGLWLCIAGVRGGAAEAGMITVDVSDTVRYLRRNPTGLCLSFASDCAHPSPRRDFAEAIREIRSGSLRFPMGTLAENYLWHTPGDYADATAGLRPRVVSRAKPPGGWDWAVNAEGTFRDLCLDFDEFVALCRATAAEPVVMVSSHGWKLPDACIDREGAVGSAAEWVRYANRTRGYGVTYWEIGNENDLREVRKTIDREEYLALYRDMARAMKAVDPGVRTGLGVLGADQGDYYRAAFAFCPEVVDFIVAHQYENRFRDFAEFEAGKPGRGTYTIENAIRWIDSDAPAARRAEIEILVTEYSSYSPGGAWKMPDGRTRDYRNDVMKSLVTFQKLADAVCLDPRVTFLHFWVTHSPWGYPKGGLNVANAFGPDNEILAQGRVQQVFAQFLRERMVRVSGAQGPVEAWASASEDAEHATVWLLNRSGAEQAVTVTVAGGKAPRHLTRWLFAGTGPHDTAPTWAEVGQEPVRDTAVAVSLPPVSITVLVLGL